MRSLPGDRRRDGSPAQLAPQQDKSDQQGDPQRPLRNASG